jgi:hypothetical protein
MSYDYRPGAARDYSRLLTNGSAKIAHKFKKAGFSKNKMAI